MRTYEQTHPWLSFAADLRAGAPKLWVLLGECQSKCEHIAGVPLRPDTAQQLYLLYLAKGVLATTAIEGNTLSEEQVVQHLQGKLKLPPSQEYLAQEVTNIETGCNLILSDIQEGRPLSLSVERIKKLNLIVLNKLSVGEEVAPGELRRHEVGVARYKAPPATDCEHLLERLCRWLNGDEFTAPKGMEVAHAVIKAVLAHLYLAWIHPFGDGNGRTARLVEIQILMSSGMPAPAAHLLSNHYNQTRAEYYRQLDQASRSGGEVLPFIAYAVQGFVDGLRSQLKHVRSQQWDLAWRNYVHELFGDEKGPVAIRRRRLVLDLSMKSEPVAFSKLVEVSPRVSLAYGKRTVKALSRDIKALVAKNLIEKTGQGFRARKELILAFLPPKAPSP